MTTLFPPREIPVILLFSFSVGLGLQDALRSGLPMATFLRFFSYQNNDACQYYAVRGVLSRYRACTAADIAECKRKLNSLEKKGQLSLEKNLGTCLSENFHWKKSLGILWLPIISPERIRQFHFVFGCRTMQRGAGDPWNVHADARKEVRGQEWHQEKTLAREAEKGLSKSQEEPNFQVMHGSFIRLIDVPS